MILVRHALHVGVLISFLTIVGMECRAQADVYSFLTYNTENTFDTIPAVDGHDDHEFSRQGSYRWTRGRYMRKLQHVAQVIMAADTLHPVDFAFLQEVESDTVLTDLLHRTKLASLPYDYIMSHSRDPRGVNVALIYGRERFFPSHSGMIRLCDSAHRTRDILYVSGIIGHGDTLDLYVLHLPSRLGANEARRNRRTLLGQLAAHVDSVVAHRRVPRIVLAGDWNEAPESKDIRHFVNPDGKQIPRLVNLMEDRKGGSYKFHGRWEWIDQIMVSPALLEEGRGLRLQHTSSPVRALTLNPLLEEDSTWGGQKPYRAFRGPTWHGGYSDHLPVVMTLKISDDE